MTEEELANLFNPFTRGDSEQAASEGHGLGLSIARKLATGMGAQIHVSSEPGKGSEFVLALPLATERERSASY